MSYIPRHVGYIVDGNRRWAQERGLTSAKGHAQGYDVLKDILVATIEASVPYVSAYVFSTENWKRSEEEVSWLMKLLLRVFKQDLKVFQEKNIRLRVIGTRERLSTAVVRAIERAEEATRANTAGQAILCFNYGGQLEITDAIKKIVQLQMPVEEITPEIVAQHLYAPDIPPCDLIVRTSGEQRLSNFMLWRSAYSELMFLDKKWPDMTQLDVEEILKQYSDRSRRFGG